MRSGYLFSILDPHASCVIEFDLLVEDAGIRSSCADATSERHTFEISVHEPAPVSVRFIEKKDGARNES